MKYYRILLLGILLLVLAGCGQKSGLYLPDKETKTDTASDQESK